MKVNKTTYNPLPNENESSSKKFEINEENKKDNISIAEFQNRRGANG